MQVGSVLEFLLSTIFPCVIWGKLFPFLLGVGLLGVIKVSMLMKVTFEKHLVVRETKGIEDRTFSTTCQFPARRAGQ